MDLMDFLETMVRRCESCGSRSFSITKVEEKGSPGFWDGMWGSVVSVGDEHCWDAGVHVLYRCTQCGHTGRKVFDPDFLTSAAKLYMEGKR